MLIYIGKWKSGLELIFFYCSGTLPRNYKDKSGSEKKMSASANLGMLFRNIILLFKKDQMYIHVFCYEY